MLSVEIYPMYFASGIFVWWPQEPKFNVTSYTIQFWHNDTTNPTIFSDQAIGTTVQLNEYEAIEDIEQHFVKISATTNIYPRIHADSISDMTNENVPIANDRLHNKNNGHLPNDTITEVRVPGNVTGILIPNTKRIVIRVLIPIIFENKEFYQDWHYVQWKVVSMIIFIFKRTA